jgi:hypothetical protein
VRCADARGASPFGPHAQPTKAPKLTQPFLLMRLLQHKRALSRSGATRLLRTHARASVGSVETLSSAHAQHTPERSSSPSCGRSLYHRETCLLAVCLMMAVGGGISLAREEELTTGPGGRAALGALTMIDFATVECFIPGTSTPYLRTGRCRALRGVSRCVSLVRGSDGPHEPQQSPQRVSKVSAAPSLGVIK